jgi:hypothetical protein
VNGIETRNAHRDFIAARYTRRARFVTIAMRFRVNAPAHRAGAMSMWATNFEGRVTGAMRGPPFAPSRDTPTARSLNRHAVALVSCDGATKHTSSLRRHVRHQREIKPDIANWAGPEGERTLDQGMPSA